MVQIINRVDSVIWGVDDNGNLVPFRTNSSGQQGTRVGELVPLGWEQVTLSGTTVSQLHPPSGCTHCFMSISGTASEYLRFSFSNTPTPTRGAKVIVGDYIDITDPLTTYEALIAALKLVRDTAATQNIILDVEYFGQELV